MQMIKLIDYKNKIVLIDPSAVVCIQENGMVEVIFVQSPMQHWLR